MNRSDELAVAYAEAVAKCYLPQPECTEPDDGASCWHQLCEAYEGETNFEEYAENDDELCVACAAHRDARPAMKAARQERARLRRMLAARGRTLLRTTT